MKPQQTRPKVKEEEVVRKSPMGLRKVSPLDYVRGPQKMGTPEEEADKAVERILGKLKNLLTNR